MIPEEQKNFDAWAEAIRHAREIDPIIREALRPVFDRLQADTPQMASAMALSMICRALRMVESKTGDKRPYQIALLQAAMMEVAANPDHPRETRES